MANCLPDWDFLFIFSRNVLWPTMGKKYTDTISHLCILLINLVFPKLLVFLFLDECLFSHMEKLGRRLFLGEAMFYFNQVLHAVDYLHTLPTPVIHKDIKGEISFNIQGSIFIFIRVVSQASKPDGILPRLLIWVAWTKVQNYRENSDKIVCNFTI